LQSSLFFIQELNLSKAKVTEVAVEPEAPTKNEVVSAIAKVEDPRKGFKYFISAEPEIQPWSISFGEGISVRGLWDSVQERIVFRCPDELAERFSRHHHVAVGRLVELVN